MLNSMFPTHPDTLFLSDNNTILTKRDAQPPRTTALNLMSATEVEAILLEAESCAEGECALDEVESLLNNLQSQQSALSKRIGEIDVLIKDLESTNGQPDRPVDEVRETVRAIFRIFAMGVSIIITHVELSPPRTSLRDFLISSF